MDNAKDVYRVVLPEEYLNSQGRRENTSEAWFSADLLDGVWVELRRRAVQKALKELDLRGIIELPPDAPKWVAVVEYGTGRVLALVSVEVFMR